MSNKPGFFRQLKDTQNYSTKFLIVLFSPNSGVTPNLTSTLDGIFSRCCDFVGVGDVTLAEMSLCGSIGVLEAFLSVR